MSTRRVSIKDVAREAGVSVTTVSHALNGKGRLNPDTRRKVQEVAQRLGYRPNPAARSLVSGRTGLIAVVTSLPTQPRIEFSEVAYFTDLIGAATGAAVARDVALVVAPPGDRGGFVWDRVPLDGVIVIDPLVGEPSLPILRERRIPFVTIGADPSGVGTDDAVVEADEDDGTCRLLDHMAARGAERIGLLTVPPLNAVLADTRSCFERWTQREGRPLLVSQLELHGLARDREAAVTRAVAGFMDRAQPDAIYAPLEMLGAAVSQSLSALGKRIPDDVMLATTYDAGRVEIADPPITTLTFDSREMGRRAAELVLDLVEGRRSAPVRETVPTRLEPRGSTARG
jgi:DNA-binding LacI/PurR family transcriptional regulator